MHIPTIAASESNAMAATMLVSESPFAFSIIEKTATKGLDQVATQGAPPHSTHLPIFAMTDWASARTVLKRSKGLNCLG